MLDPRRQRWFPYVRDLADKLGLRDSKIAIDDDGPFGADDTAAIHCVEGRRIGHIRLSDDFLGAKPVEQRQTVVHELLHLHVDAAWRIAIGAMPEPVHLAYRLMAEHGVDAIATAIAPLLPLPKFPKS
jgi:hypothetical protein